MNGNQDNFGLDSIQPLEPVVPTPTVEDNEVPVTSVEIPVQEPQTQFAFTTEVPTVDSVVPVEPVAPVEMPIQESQTPFAFTTEAPVVDPVVSVEPVSYEEPTVATTSFTEIPVAGVTEQQPEFGVVNEHPDAKISLRKEEEEEIPVASNLPEEKMDKSTMWMLIWLFVGMLAVIIALPYMFKLF